MGIGLHNEKTITIGDTRFWVIYSLSTNLSLKQAPAPHSHSYYEVFILENGSGTITDTKKEYRIGRGNATIIPPDTDHVISVFKENREIKLFTLSFNYEKIKDHTGRSGEKIYSLCSRLFPETGSISIVKDKSFTNIVSTLRAETESEAELASVLLENLLEGLFIQLLRTLSKGNTELPAEPICSRKSSAITNDSILAKNIEDYMNMPGCTLTVLAKKLNMCPRNVQKVMKRIYGKSFSEKLVESRMKWAVHYIVNTDKPFGTIAKEVNYNQYASFRKSFIHCFGISPKEYRKQHSKAHK